VAVPDGVVADGETVGIAVPEGLAVREVVASPRGLPQALTSTTTISESHRTRKWDRFITMRPTSHKYNGAARHEVSIGIRTSKSDYG
jgi:hypothetical protein